MQNTYTLYVATAALAAAWLTAAFAFFSQLNSKHSKISDFRQDWINNLRSEVANFISNFNKCVFLQKKRDRSRAQNEEAIRKELDQQFYNTYGLLLQNKIMIHLRLNKNDSDKRLKKLNCELLKSLDDAVLALNENRCPNHDAMNDKIINPAGDILKLEWCRVKRGEIGFIVTYIMCSLILILGVVGLAAIYRTLPQVLY
ncbi:hypothetical protein ACE1BU_01935 [Aeromonas veronii]|uniref:hypothetical protein n=1 Tax=Aeromonas veronii TaxID=654 RepID=UPI0035BB2B69